MPKKPTTKPKPKTKVRSNSGILSQFGETIRTAPTPEAVEAAFTAISPSLDEATTETVRRLADVRIAKLGIAESNAEPVPEAVPPVKPDAPPEDESVDESTPSIFEVSLPPLRPMEIPSVQQREAGRVARTTEEAIALFNELNGIRATKHAHKCSRVGTLNNIVKFTEAGYLRKDYPDGPADSD